MITPPRVVGRRGAVLLYLAIVDLLYALSLCRPARAGLRAPWVHFFAEVMPLPYWGALWLVAGVVCLVGAFAHRVDRIAFAAAVAVKTLWGGVLLLGWLIGGIERGWVSAVIWLGLAVIVLIIAGWPDPAPTLVDRGR